VPSPLQSSFFMMSEIFGALPSAVGARLARALGQTWIFCHHGLEFILIEHPVAIVGLVEPAVLHLREMGGGSCWS